MTTGITYDDLKFPVYLNSRVVGSVGGTQLTVSDIINAAQLVKNNVFLAGKKGVGKTQLLRDLYLNRYGAKGMNLEGRPDLKADEVYKIVNLEKLRGGAVTSDEIIELAESVDYHFVGVDELNRCPEITQNQLLSLMNGYLLHKGKPVKLGTGFCTGVATGNLGNGKYVGTFRIDDALADRLHLFIDLDYWKPTDEDMAVLDERADLNPRIVDSEARDISDKIMQAHKEIVEQPTPLEIIIAGRYLERALDYCKKFDSAENSKDNLGEAWPTICTQKSCELRDTLCGRVKSVGERTVKAAKSLAKGLQYIARLKNPETKDDPIGAMMTATKLMLPYSGTIAPAYLREEGVFNNPNIASQKLMAEIERELNEQFSGSEKPGSLIMSLAYAVKGQLEKRPYEPEKPEWKFVRPLLRQINEKAKAEEK